MDNLTFSDALCAVQGRASEKAQDLHCNLYTHTIVHKPCCDQRRPMPDMAHVHQIKHGTERTDIRSEGVVMNHRASLLFIRATHTAMQEANRLYIYVCACETLSPLCELSCVMC